MCFLPFQIELGLYFQGMQSILLKMKSWQDLPTIDLVFLCCPSPARRHMNLAYSFNVVCCFYNCGSTAPKHSMQFLTVKLFLAVQHYSQGLRLPSKIQYSKCSLGIRKLPEMWDGQLILLHFLAVVRVRVVVVATLKLTRFWQYQVCC